MAITMGDASGVGPEIVLRCAAAGELDESVVIYGDASILEAGQALLNLSNVGAPTGSYTLSFSFISSYFMSSLISSESLEAKVINLSLI